ncbi:MAG: peptidoglycan DD-metalloendopeptidase family protein [Clostridia bacterium]|nr:peptidoglycan DD-metalloendopeptidase family protein [Clostridia bacterium]
MTVASILPILTEGETYKVTSPFGIRVDPVTGNPRAQHDGIDLVLWKGWGALSAVGAAWDGIVKTVSYDGSRGNYVVINHGGDVETHYYHLANGSVTVALGDHVTAGDVIGQMGSTGASTGAHLHFQLEIHGEPVDPLPYIVGEKSRETEESETDNIPAEWSAEAVAWAVENGILYGDEHGNLMLRQPCTREQMIVFLHRVYRLITEGTAG